MPFGPGEPAFPRWAYLVVGLLLVLIFWGAASGISTLVEKDKERKNAIVDVATKALTWGQALEKRVESLEAQVKALEERPDTINNQVLNIKAVETVCHASKRAWAIRFTKPDDSEGWVIVPKLEGWGKVNGWLATYECDGTEAVHPADRDKVLKETKQ